MNKSPAAIVKQHFGDKAKLVAALGPLTHDDLWVPRVNETKGLARVPNAKLLRLFNVLSTVKEKFGNRFKLVDAICEIEKRSKDEGFKKRLLDYPVPRLYDLYRSSAKRAGVAVEALGSRLPPATGEEAPKPKPAKAASEKSAAPKGAKATAKKATGKAASKAKATARKKGKS
jgi:hypothetical protein